MGERKVEKAPFTENDIAKCREFFENIKTLVEKELSLDATLAKTPKVAGGVQEEYAGLAEKLVDIQLEKGAIYPKNLSEAELMRIKRLAKKNEISTTEAVLLLVENGNYVGKNRADAIALTQVIEDIKNIANMTENTEKVIIVSLLSKGSKDFLVNKRFNLPMKIIVEQLVETYLPEYSNFRVSSGEVRPKITDLKKQHLRSLQDFEEFLAKQIADKTGNIDKIFLPENKEILKELIFALNNSNISFEKFMEMTGMSYTRIYKLEPLSAVKHMLKQYHSKYKTFTDITTNDPFLRKKIDVAEEVANKHSLNELLELLGLPTMAGESFKQATVNQLQARENKLINNLTEEFPEKIIPEKTYKTHEKLSDEIIYMAKRRGFDYADDYLESIGFKRNSKQKIKLSEAKFLMTEDDLLRYNFIEDDKIKSFETIAKSNGGEIASVEQNYATYSMLLFGNKYRGKNKADYRNLEKPKYFG